MTETNPQDMEFLRKVQNSKLPLLVEGTYIIRNQTEYELAQKLEEHGLVDIIRSNGIMSGSPTTKVYVTSEGKKLL